MLPVVYTRQTRWQSAENDWAWRPQCMITVHGAMTGSAQDLLGILDTGADHLMLPEYVAHALGIDVSSCNQEMVTVASGQQLSMPRTQVDVTIRNTRIKVTALFGTNGSPVLIGLHTIVKAMKFGVMTQGWLYGRPGRSNISSIFDALMRRRW